MVSYVDRPTLVHYYEHDSFLSSWVKFGSPCNQTPDAIRILVFSKWTLRFYLISINLNIVLLIFANHQYLDPVFRINFPLNSNLFFSHSVKITLNSFQFPLNLFQFTIHFYINFVNLN